MHRRQAVYVIISLAVVGLFVVWALSSPGARSTLAQSPLPTATFTPGPPPETPTPVPTPTAPPVPPPPSAGYDPYLLKDIQSGSLGSFPRDFVAFDDRLFFRADDGTHGDELWVTDGTRAGTSLLKDIWPGSEASFEYGFESVTFAGRVFFEADDGDHGWEVWVTDGSPAGTTLLKDIDPGSHDSRPNEFTVLGNRLFFEASDGAHGWELWVTDGSPAGTTLLKDIRPGGSGSNPQHFVASGRLFFMADDGAHGWELWVSDGTPGGTILLKDIRSGNRGSHPIYFTPYAGRLFFQADDGTHGRELWVTDGTWAGTILLKDIRPGGDSSAPWQFAVFDHRVFFSAHDGTHGSELWVTDGTPAGTVLFKDINPGSQDSYPSSFTAFDGRLYFRASDGSHGTELWVTDGTPGGTALVADIYPGTDGSGPSGLTAFDGRLFFQADDGTYGDELWVTDGTPAGTVIVEDINPGAYGSFPSNFTPLGDQLLFSAYEPHGDELWAMGPLPQIPPTASADSHTTDEDLGFVVGSPGVLANDSDPNGDSLTAVLDALPGHGSLTLSADGAFQYLPGPNYCGPDSFTYHAHDGVASSNIATVDLDVICINDPPVVIADQPSVTVLESQTATNSGTVTDPDGNAVALTASVGVVTLGDGGTWDWAFPTSDGPAQSQVVTLWADDGRGGAGQTTFVLTVENLPPSLSADPTAQALQYSDALAPVTVTATDVAADALTLSGTEWKQDGGSFNPGLPNFLSLNAQGCVPDGGTQTCTWTLGGLAGVPAGGYAVRVSVTDDDGGAISVDLSLTVSPEAATVSFDAGNPLAVPVASAGGESGPFSLQVSLSETTPDQPAGRGAPGDIALASLSLVLVPVGPGGSVAGACAPTGVSGAGYDALLTVECAFDVVPVNTYALEAIVDGGYYVGSGEDVLTVYDPSLGATSGGGWFAWPTTGERTNLGYTVKYNRKGTKAQGSLLLIRHLPGGASYRLQSNAIDGLAIGDEGDHGWATVSGRATYREPGWPEPLGNYTFVVYVEDHGEPGADRVWLEVHDRHGIQVAALSMTPPPADYAALLQGGGLIVSNGAGGQGGPP